MDGLRLDLEFSTGGNESRVALLPGGFRGGAAPLCWNLWLSTFHRYPRLSFTGNSPHPIGFLARKNLRAEERENPKRKGNCESVLRICHIWQPLHSGAFVVS